MIFNVSFAWNYISALFQLCSFKVIHITTFSLVRVPLSLACPFNFFLFFFKGLSIFLIVLGFFGKLFVWGFIGVFKGYLILFHDFF